MSLDNKNTHGTVKALTYKAKVTFAATSSLGIDSNQVYTSNWVDAYDYDTIRGVVYISGSEIGETIGGSFQIEQTADTGSIYLTGSIYSVSNATATFFNETLYTRYTRLIYTNNAASGSVFTSGSFVVDSFLVP